MWVLVNGMRTGWLKRASVLQQMVNKRAHVLSEGRVWLGGRTEMEKKEGEGKNRVSGGLKKGSEVMITLAPRSRIISS